MAKKVGADDAWMVQDGYVTEGTSNNAYIIKNNKIVTRGLSNDLLHGSTRAAVLRFAKEAQMQVEERNFTLDEAYKAGNLFDDLESVVGEVFKGKDLSDVKITTKCRLGTLPDDDVYERLNSSLNKSLDNLNMERVDLFLLHSQLRKDDFQLYTLNE